MSDYQQNLDDFSSVLEVLLNGRDTYLQLRHALAELSPAERFTIYAKYAEIRRVHEDAQIFGEDNQMRGYLACLPTPARIKYEIAVRLTDTIREINAENKFRIADGHGSS